MEDKRGQREAQYATEKDVGRVSTIVSPAANSSLLRS
jgi:hypothetical protein